MNEYSRLISIPILDPTSVRIHLFGGDWDDIVPVDNTIKNLEKLGLRQNIPMKHWVNTTTNQHIGFQRQYAQGQRIIKYWVIKGAGH